MHTGKRLTSSCRELVHHSRLQGHPHIIAMREAYLTNDHLCVVMDYASGGDLAEHLSRHVYKTVRICRPVIRHHEVELLTSRWRCAEAWHRRHKVVHALSASRRYTGLMCSCSFL